LRGAKGCWFKRCLKCCQIEASNAQLENRIQDECGLHYNKKVLGAELLASQASTTAFQIPATTSDPSIPKPGSAKLYANSVGPLWAEKALEAQQLSEKTLLNKKGKLSLKKAIVHQVSIVVYHLVGY
jgi:hypothetical protein